MGTDMRAHLEYNQTGNYWVSLSNWDLIRDYDMYRLLANVRGEGALYPPRGIPHDANDDTRRAYLMPVVEDAERLSRVRVRNPLAISLAEAEDLVARGHSHWLEFNGIRFVNNSEYHHASWLTTAEFRDVVDYYIAHKLEFLQQRHQDYLDRERDLLSKEEHQRRLATPNWDTSLTPEQWLSTEFWMLLAAMEAGEARGYSVRLIFWFHG
jgi:hypothetical protein